MSLTSDRLKWSKGNDDLRETAHSSVFITDEILRKSSTNPENSLAVCRALEEQNSMEYYSSIELLQTPACLFIPSVKKETWT